MNTHFRTTSSTMVVLSLLLSVSIARSACAQHAPAPKSTQRHVVGELEAHAYRHDGKRQVAYLLISESGVFAISGGGKDYRKLRKFRNKTVVVTGKEYKHKPVKAGKREYSATLEISGLSDVRLQEEAPAGTDAPADAAEAKDEGEEPAHKILMVVASRFADTELLEPRQAFEKKGFTVEVASNTVKPLQGMGKTVVKPDHLMRDVDVKHFAAVVFVGGPGAQLLFDNADAHQLAKTAVTEKKILAAICIAPVILARAGVLKDKKATVWDDKRKSFSKILREAGAIVRKHSVVKSGRIITANGPDAAHKFAKTILKKLAH